MDANIQKYQAFVEVADAGSFTKAAETLAYSQSGISHMVSDLERDWGVALFERSRRGVVLTGDGARLLPEARALCESFRALEATVDEVRGLETGLIRIGVFPSVAAHWIPRIIKRFNADYPGIDYKLRVSDYTEIEEWIAAGTVDCGFVMLPLRTDARLVVRALEEDEFLAVLPRDHELASAEVFPVERLAELPLLSPASESDDELLEFLKRWGVRQNPHFTSWDDRAILSMVEYGMGVSVLSRLMCPKTWSRCPCPIRSSAPSAWPIAAPVTFLWPPAASSITWNFAKKRSERGRPERIGMPSERRLAPLRVESRAVCAFSCAARSVALLWFQL